MSREFTGLDHIGVAVRNLQEATQTYGETLGFQVVGGESLPDRGLQVCFVDTGDARIELIAPTRDDSEVSKFLATRGEGVHHVCVRVGNLDATLARMVQRGATLVGGGPKPGAHGRRVAFVHPKSTHGVLLELAEETPGAPRDDTHGGDTGAD